MATIVTLFILGISSTLLLEFLVYQRKQNKKQNAY